MPVTTLSAPSGSPASVASRASSMVVAEVYSEGLMTTVFPAASAGAADRADWPSGTFHGVMTPMTP